MAYLFFIWCKMMINHEMVEGYPTFRETKDAIPVNHWPSVPKSRGFACVFPGTGEPRRMVVKSPSEITNEMDGNHD
jgi:hypothetical protein